MIRGRIRYSCIYIARMSPTLSGSSALKRVKLGDALEMHDRIIFNFYSGLPHIYSFLFVVTMPFHVGCLLLNQCLWACCNQNGCLYSWMLILYYPDFNGNSCFEELKLQYF